MGVVVYTGQCSKIMMNGQSFVSKLSTVERKLNYLLVVMLVVQLAVCLMMAAFSTSKEMEMRESQAYLIWRNYGRNRLFVMNFLLFFVEYSSLIPVSLIVSIEIAKTAQSYFIDFDQLMFSSWRKRKAYARMAALNE
jgi:magnesium-transporting ATPase (P-type)